jgi:CheY-like chemotaxis protein
MDERRHTILVVDDDAHFRGFLQRMLEEAGYSAATASSGSEALEKLLTGNISLVVLDILMPGMDGFQTL